MQSVYYLFKNFKFVKTLLKILSFDTVNTLKNKNNYQ